MNTPKKIYLEPECPDCEENFGYEGRTWCADAVYSDVCDGCQGPMVIHTYILSTEKEGE